MDALSFQRILTSFADTPADVDVSKGKVLVQIRNELIDARLFLREGALIVEENSSKWTAEQWLVRRIAQLPLLADRILGFVPEEPTFVVPSGSFLDELERAPEEHDANTVDAVSTARDFLARRPAGTASVLYLTADAGEGKTTVIYELSRQLARAYKQKTVDWLLVPISLGGRPFLRFDDVIVAALVNRLRFPFLYYESFIELVRLGVLVPALDGFEEMFIENVAGDAVSALGNLMRELQSSGAALIAARKAYFEFSRLETQARLFDTLAGTSVTFARLALQRWDRGHFIDYGHKRQVDKVEELYNEVAERIGAPHPLLTRAVLARRLFEVTEESETRRELLRRLEDAPGDYLLQFVRAIVSREAQEKWIDKSGEPASPLLSEEEHHELLGMVAQEMWTGGVEALREEVVDLVAELFCDSLGKSTVVQRQVVERLKQHALIVQAEPGAKVLAFDHVEFFHFFLGCAVGVALRSGFHADLRQIMGRGPLPDLAIDVATARLRSQGADVMSLIELLNLLGRTDTRPSFVRENAGNVALSLVRAESTASGVRLEDLTLPSGALSLGNLANTIFTRCYFQPTSVRSGITNDVIFDTCEFEALSLLDDLALVGAHFVDCALRSISRPGSEDEVFVPGQIMMILERSGAKVTASKGVIAEEPVEPDEALHLTRRVLRAFTRATELNENTIKKRLGGQGSHFLAKVLPDLLDAGMIDEIAYHGQGSQRRFRLVIALSKIEKYIENSQGNFERFLKSVRATTE